MNAEEQLKEIRTAGGKSIAQTQKEQQRRSRITAVVLASSTIVSLIFLVYAFNQKQRADELEADVVKLKAQLEQCQSE